MRLLVLTQLAFNVGFYMVLPYLRHAPREDLGLAAALVGLVLGLRTFSQQGMFVVGGALADRSGPTGRAGRCALRVAGFVLLGAPTRRRRDRRALLTGFAAALFSPAVESTLAREAGERARRGPDARRGVRAVRGQRAGRHRHRAAGRDRAAARRLPAGLHRRGRRVRADRARAPAHGCRGGAARRRAVLAGWSEVLRNRRFLVFAAYSGWLLCYNQLYLALPSS